MNQKTLIILAAGQGSRLAKFYFPKVLLPYKNKAMLNHIIDFWQADEVIIVCRPEIREQIATYTDHKYTYLTEHRRGSAFALYLGVQAAKHNKIIANWCDILLTKEVTLGEHNLIFTSPEIECRFNGQLGGIFGLFYFDRQTTTLNQPPYTGQEIDFMDVIDLSQFQEMTANAIDIGDSEKYTLEKRICKHPARSFNQITIKEDLVIKQCSNPELSIAEENWYQRMSPVCDFVLNPLAYNPLVLPKINHQQLFNHTKPLYSIAEKIHQAYPPKPVNVDDCFNMYITKTIDRLAKIDYLINNKDQFYVNNCLCSDPIKRLRQVAIDDLLPTQFTPIHGDLTTSNVLWEQQKPYIIDPRGMFGQTLLYGDPDYDIAKIYYSTTNWHLLNKGALMPQVISENAFIVEDILEYGDKKIDFLLAIIWLSVTEYVKSNTLSVLYAYLQGSFLLERWLEKYK